MFVHIDREYTPSELARALGSEFGHKVTPSVIRKWDNEIFSDIAKKARAENAARNYRYKDLLTFNAIAILRNLGYSIKDIKAILGYTMEERAKEDAPGKRTIVLDQGIEKIYSDIRATMDKRRKADNLFEEFLKQF